MERDEYKKMDDFQKGHWWYRGRRFIASTLFRQYVGGARKSGSFLDVGCGTGEGAFVVENAGQLIGVDESHEALALARDKGYAALYEGTAGQLPFSDVLFHGALALDVLEHLEDDSAALEECARVLLPRGVLFLTVPAYPWLWSGHDEVFGHKRRYLKNDLVKKVEEAGFEILFASYYVTLLFPAIALFRWIEKKFRNRRASHFFTLPKIINGFLFSLIVFEAVLLRIGCRLPFGSSIVLVAEKK